MEDGSVCEMNGKRIRTALTVQNTSVLKWRWAVKDPWSQPRQELLNSWCAEILKKELVLCQFSFNTEILQCVGDCVMSQSKTWSLFYCSQPSLQNWNMCKEGKGMCLHRETHQEHSLTLLVGDGKEVQTQRQMYLVMTPQSGVSVWGEVVISFLLPF